MKIFFSKWVQETDKYKALREAQLTIRKEVMEENLGHDMVHLWGGLVLVGHGKN
jgi:CHAT domain-containing protein